VVGDQKYSGYSPTEVSSQACCVPSIIPLNDETSVIGVEASSVSDILI
jgi:hypothetical protein